VANILIRNYYKNKKPGVNLAFLMEKTKQGEAAL
jgi:hypothetical protein